VEFTFSWAPLREISADVPRFVAITPDFVSIIRETARIFRETETVESSDLVGVVNKLQHQGQDHGKVTIVGTADSAARSVSLDLSGTEHSLAVRSYEERVPISCVGELTREGASWVLRNPREVRLLTENEKSV